MSPLSSSRLDLNTEHISVSSKRGFEKQSVTYEAEPVSETNAVSYKREVPYTQESEFVIVDGKKYFLDAPRGSYLDIMV